MIQKGGTIDTASGVSAKETLLRLKDGESVNVRILNYEDWVGYEAHNHFEKGIYPSTCGKMFEKDCPYCVAVANGGKEFSALRAKTKYLIAMYNLDTEKIMMFDATASQAKALTEGLKDYKDDLGTFAFKFKRTGKKTDTTYTLQLIPRMNADLQAKFDAAEDLVAEIKLFEDLLKDRMASEAFQVKLLGDAGFPISEHFSAELIAEGAEIGKDKDSASAADSV